MPLQDILDSIDQEISQLQRARTLLAGNTSVELPGKRRGRPKGSTNKPQVPTTPVAKKAVKRPISPKGKAGIATVQKGGSAKQKKAAATPKKTVITSSSAMAKKPSKPAGNKTLAKKTSAAKKKAAPSNSTSEGQSASSSAEASVA